jgi:asparagine synthase (glutamine-hydrolysing)
LVVVQRDPLPPDAAELDRAFDRAIAATARASEPLAVLFSGGVDSAVLAWELRHRPSTTLVTVGFDGADDLVAARTAATRVGIPWTGAILTEEGLEEVVRRCADALDGVPGTRRSLFVALAAAVGSAPVTDVVCGQGADELFLGYAHFRGLAPALAEERVARDLDRLQQHDWPRSVRIAETLGRRLHAPFLDPEFVRAARAVPIVDRLPSAESKGWWRAWALRRGVPAELVRRPKRALQFGTGVDAWWRRRERRSRGTSSAKRLRSAAGTTDK